MSIGPDTVTAVHYASGCAALVEFVLDGHTHRAWVDMVSGEVLEWVGLQ